LVVLIWLIALCFCAVGVADAMAAVPAARTHANLAGRTGPYATGQMRPGPPPQVPVGSVSTRSLRAASLVTTFPCQNLSPAQCYGPSQIRAAYGVDQMGLDGSGQTIVIVDAFQSPTVGQDLASFDNEFDLPAPPSFQILAPDGLTAFDPHSAEQVSWAAEITLDVEWAHAIAPAAKIDLVLAKGQTDSELESAIHYAVTSELGDVISMSFGEAEACMLPATLRAEHADFQAAVNEGITLLAASGDDGAAQPTCDGSSFMEAASTPASDPLVTGVGGTSLAANGMSGAYESESVWNEPNDNAAGGGGFSALYTTPSYQSALDLPARGVPDVAYNAARDPGVMIVWSSSGQGSNLVFVVGGTSAGSPQWAGIVALADQSAGHPLGLINPTLYQVASDAAGNAQDFHDVTLGDNTYHGVSVTVPGYAAASGWDPATGLGSPQASALVPRLAIGLIQLAYDGPTRGQYGTPLTLSAQLTHDGAGFAGRTVTFSFGAESCQGVTDGSGNANCSVTPTDAPGSYPVTATLTNAPVDEQAKDTSESLAIAKVPTSTQLVSSATPAVAGETLTYTATVTRAVDGQGTPAGAVSFADGSSPINGCASVLLDNTGQARCEVTYQTASGPPHGITASYGGNQDFGSSSASLSETVGAAALTGTVGPAATRIVQAGARIGLLSITLSATLIRADDQAPVPGKPIAFYAQNRHLCDATTDNAGVAECTVHPALMVTLGSVIYRASFSGDADDLSATLTEGLPSGVALARFGVRHGRVREGTLVRATLSRRGIVFVRGSGRDDHGLVWIRPRLSRRVRPGHYTLVLHFAHSKRSLKRTIILH
jgi:hypothetical protein